MSNTGNKNKRIDPLPEEFRTEEEAANFWDTHSISDYEEFLEPACIEVDSLHRHYEIEIDEDAFTILRSTAKKRHRDMRKLASEILKQKLAAA